MSDSNIPAGWALTTIGAVASHWSGNSSLIKGKLSKVPGYGLYPAYSASGQDVWLQSYNDTGDAIIISAVGARCGKVFRASGKWSAIANTHIVKIDPSGGDFRYFYYLLNREQFWVKSGTAQPFVKVKATFERPFLLPPLNEQHRIVAKIEELFSELDKGIDNLKQARAQLAVYRQALLKHAFEGKLTAQWRETHADKLESPDQILARIRSEREERYQKNYKAWKISKAGGDDTASKPRELIPWADVNSEELNDLPAVPLGWIWTSFCNLCEVIRNGISAKPTGDTGDKILRISAVRPLKVDLNDVRFIRSDANDYEDYVLKVGDLLFTRYNGSRRFVGVCGHFKGTERRLFPDKLIQARLGIDCVLPEFIEAAFGCGASRKFVESRIRTTAGQAGVSGGDIKSVPVPICSIDEQKEIVRILEESLPNIEALESDIDQNLQKAEAMRQSILKKAFAGELVSQDPNDEPASELLARIHAEREAGNANSKPGRAALPRRPNMVRKTATPPQ